MGVHVWAFLGVSLLVIIAPGQTRVDLLTSLLPQFVTGRESPLLPFPLLGRCSA